MPKDKVDYQVINATYDAIAPLVKAHGATKESIGQYCFYLLIIAAAIADQVGIDADHFRALSRSAYDIGRDPSAAPPKPTN